MDFPLGSAYGLVERFFARGLMGRHDSVTSFLLALMAATALISMLIPNFVTALELYKAPGREKINFLSWFGWSKKTLPLGASAPFGRVSTYF